MARMHKKAKQALRLLMEQFNDSTDGQEFGPLSVGRVQEAGGRLPVQRKLFLAVATVDVMDTATGEHAGRQARQYLVAGRTADAAKAAAADALYADPQVTGEPSWTVTPLTGHVYLVGAEGAGSIVPPQPAQPVVEAPIGTATVDAPHSAEEAWFGGPRLVESAPVQAAGEQ